MPDKTPQPVEPVAEVASLPKDLRAELDADLKSEFTANLSAAGILPKVACDALVALLGANGPISAEILAALGLEDPTHPEVPNE